ncbi:hypothetical protein K3495_g4813 [Podosphaera aphanis]|nr:hypothetical protein K3495_g4813 [Podosphaera aphanis]
MLADNLGGLAPLPNQPNTAALDEHAEALSGCIHSALEGSAKKANADNLGNSWWTPECREARRTYKHSEKGVLDRRQFRRVTANAKKRYFRDKIEAANKPKDVFRMAIWHKSTGVYPPPPPQRDPTTPPDVPLAASLHDKRQILLQHLLKEAAEAQDIPLDSPAVPTRELVFENITDQEAGTGHI